jgi:signal transduction histidine kinase
MGTLTAGMAHEMNNPLNYIAGGLEIVEEVKPEVLKDLEPNAATDYKNGIQIIRKGFEKAKKIVDTFLTFTTKENPEKELVNLNHLIDNTLLFMRYKFPEELNIRKKYRLPGPILGYRDKLQQIFHSILDNAVTAINNNQKISDEYIDIETYMDTSSNPEMVIVDISNTGPEISKEDLSQIFDPFFTTKEPGMGTGLGLSIAYTYIKEHKGTINAENTGSGVRFRIRFPLLISTETEK